MQDFYSAIRPKGKSTLIDISVTPNANRTEIKGFSPWRKRVIVRVKERPLQNRANREIADFFSKLFNAEVKIVSGAKNNKKTLEVSIHAEKARRTLNEIKQGKVRENH